MSCVSSGAEVVQGSDGTVGFQLAVDGRAQPFDDATSVTARLITADLQQQTGPVFTLTDTGSNDWRSGYGVLAYTATDSAAMTPGNYRVEVTTTQPTVNVRIWRTDEIVKVVQTPS